MLVTLNPPNMPSNNSVKLSGFATLLIQTDNANLRNTSRKGGWRHSILASHYDLLSNIPYHGCAAVDAAIPCRLD